MLRMFSSYVFYNFPMEKDMDLKLTNVILLLLFISDIHEWISAKLSIISFLYCTRDSSRNDLTRPPPLSSLFTSPTTWEFLGQQEWIFQISTSSISNFDIYILLGTCIEKQEEHIALIPLNYLQKQIKETI